MKLKSSIPLRNVTLRENGALQIHHSPADILAAEVPIVISNPANWKRQSSVHEAKGMLCIPNSMSLPIDRCIKTNRPATKIVMVDVRNPFNPLTWWTKNPRTIMVGLSSGAHARYRAIIACARINLSAAFLTSICGLFWGPWFFGVSLLFLIAAGLLKTGRPIQVSECSGEIIAVKGACTPYLREVST